MPIIRDHVPEIFSMMNKAMKMKTKKAYTTVCTCPNLLELTPVRAEMPSETNFAMPAKKPIA